MYPKVLFEVGGHRELLTTGLLRTPEGDEGQKITMQTMLIVRYIPEGFFKAFLVL